MTPNNNVFYFLQSRLFLPLSLRLTAKEFILHGSEGTSLTPQRSRLAIANLHR